MVMAVRGGGNSDAPCNEASNASVVAGVQKKCRAQLVRPGSLLSKRRGCDRMAASVACLTAAVRLRIPEWQSELFQREVERGEGGSGHHGTVGHAL